MINKFEGKNAFLSNYFPCKVTFQNITYDSAEAAYQAQKCMDEHDKYQFANLDADDAKHLGRRVVMRPDWDTAKLNIMRKVVEAKFYQNKDLRQKLVATGDHELIEGNWWNDRYWGMYLNKDGTMIGENHLGKILMELRGKYINEV